MIRSARHRAGGLPARRSFSEPPGMYFIARKKRPSNSPRSYTGTMCGCSRRAAICASWRKRSMNSGSTASAGCSTLTACSTLARCGGHGTPCQTRPSEGLQKFVFTEDLNHALLRQITLLEARSQKCPQPRRDTLFYPALGENSAAAAVHDAFLVYLG